MGVGLHRIIVDDSLEEPHIGGSLSDCRGALGEEESVSEKN